MRSPTGRPRGRHRKYTGDKRERKNAAERDRRDRKQIAARARRTKESTPERIDAALHSDSVLSAQNLRRPTFRFQLSGRKTRIERWSELSAEIDARAWIKKEDTVE